jgi:hypothetical protein
VRIYFRSIPGSSQQHKNVVTGRFFALLAALFVLPFQAHAGIVYNPENGHSYQAVIGPVTWEQARVAALGYENNGVTGHLVTITSASENLFLTNTYTASGLDGLWIGGYQPAGSAEPNGGWRWVTDEPFVYTNWFGSEPSNTLGNEDSIIFAHPVQTDGKPWNDANGTSLSNGFIVEYDGSSVPEPNQICLVIASAAVFGGISRRRRLRRPATEACCGTASH